MTSHEKFLEDNTKAMVAEVMRFLNKQQKAKGKLAAKELALNFIAGFIGAQVYSALKDRPSNIKSDRAMEQYITQNFAALKVEIQNGVAAGFQGALQEFTGKPVEYYCQIKIVPEIVNKKPC